MHKYLLPLLVCIIMFPSFQNHTTSSSQGQNEKLATLLEQYFDERMHLFPLEATQNAISTEHYKLYADFTDSYREKLRNFFSRYRSQLAQFKGQELNENDRISYNIFKREMDITLEGLALGFFSSNVLYPEHQYIPFNQFGGVPLWIGQQGSGTGSQPFKTVVDYENWIGRATAFNVWADSAIIYFRKGIAANIVLPAALVKKMIPQMNDMVVSDPENSLFYDPVKNMPATFAEADRQRLTEAYKKLISEQIVPAYKKLGNFLENEYLPKARKSTGISAVPRGKETYAFLIRYWTTTNLKPEQIYQTGLAEVKRIRTAMDSVRKATGFQGNLNAFFTYMSTDPKFKPYKTPEEVLAAFRAIQQRIEPNLKNMFGKAPRSLFEIRQTEAFRAASASAEYNAGSADGKRPGIFYIPILDATQFNTTSGMESLFLHEAIPGHHYQISLQQENESLPRFRRYAWYGAFGEGWALYTESLGKELGLYTDPYQYMGALGDEIHRAIRLVVDVGMHSRNMTREQAIKYMMENEPISEQGAIAEIERYMAIPAQALSYKVGALKIRDLRNKYQRTMGNRFSLAAFHDQLLEGGVMPLEIAEQKMDAWAKTQ